MVLSGISHIITSLLVVVIAAFIAYAIAPVVEFFHKAMPRPLAILLAYMIVIAILVVISYVVVSTAVLQISVLANNVGVWLTPNDKGQISLLALLLKTGLTQAQITALEQQVEGTLTNLAGSLAGGILPILGGVAGGMINILLTIVISIYLLVDGARAVKLMRTSIPRSTAWTVQFNNRYTPAGRRWIYPWADFALYSYWNYCRCGFICYPIPFCSVNGGSDIHH